jgi:putative restriction endonuclease
MRHAARCARSATGGCSTRRTSSLTATRGEPIVPNGLALCKIHHAAYDQNILGIRPDCVVEIHARLLDEVDGPMLLHGLQKHHGRELMQRPRRRADQPDPDRLMERYSQFLAA